MKAFIVLFALVAAAYADAEAEADPYLLYGGYNGYHGYGLGGYGAYPYGLGAYGYHHGIAGVNAYGLPAVPHGLHGVVKSVETTPAKVEVKALPAPVVAAPVLAHAPLLAAAPALGYAHLAGAPCTNHLGVAVPCALGHPLVKTAAVAHVVAKREAEADPQIVLGGAHNVGFGPLGLVPAAGVNAVGLPALPHSLYGAVKSVEHTPAKVEVKALDPVVVAAPVAATYHYGLGGALAHPFAHAIGKRDAEADADPAYFYNGYAGYAGLGYAGYGYGLAHHYGAYAGYGLGAYGYGAGLYGAYHGLGLAPSDPTNPHLVHTSRVGICTNYLGASVPC